MIEHYLGRYFYYWACFTFITDYLGYYIVGIMIGYNIYIYILYYQNFIDQ